MITTAKLATGTGAVLANLSCRATCPFSLSVRRARRPSMPRPEEYEVLILGSGKSGKHLAAHLAGSR
jgi:hypothetical protein